MNTPDLDTLTSATPLRRVAGVPDEAKLVIYVGGVAPSRGAEDLIEAVSHLPLDVHLTFVAGRATGYIAKLQTMSNENGLGDRVHFAPFVSPEAVVSYIRSADVSVIPLSRGVANYEVTLPNSMPVFRLR
jgi:glycosyltransferase involved in cell wall biosynthesis